MWTPSNARRTRRQISDIKIWLQRQHGDIDFYISQLLTGHGCFLEYLYRLGIAEYSFCANIVQSPGHVFFDCPRFCVERASLNRHLVCEVRLDNIMDIMLHSENQWVLVANFVKSVLVELRNDCN